MLATAMSSRMSDRRGTKATPSARRNTPTRQRFGLRSRTRGRGSTGSSRGVGDPGDTASGVQVIENHADATRRHGEHRGHRSIQATPGIADFSEHRKPGAVQPRTGQCGQRALHAPAIVTLGWPAAHSAPVLLGTPQ